jgi:hypothetical protein
MCYCLDARPHDAADQGIGNWLIERELQVTLRALRRIFSRTAWMSGEHRAMYSSIVAGMLCVGIAGFSDSGRQ